MFMPQTGSFSVVADFGECSIIEAAGCTKSQPDHIRFIRLYNRLLYLQKRKTWKKEGKRQKAGHQGQSFAHVAWPLANFAVMLFCEEAK
jgi:hypothetical protein